MNKFIAALVIGAIAFSFSSCRKGEDDPFLSFSSRDKRIEGTWLLDNITLTNIEETVNEAPTGGSRTVTRTKTYSIDKTGAGTLTDVVVDNGTEQSRDVINVGAGNFSLDLTINADGTYSADDAIAYKAKGGNDLSFSNSAVGGWTWGNADKKKSIISFNAETAVDPENESDFAEAIMVGNFIIHGLNKEELKLEKKYESSTSKNSSTSGGSSTKTVNSVDVTYRK